MKNEILKQILNSVYELEGLVQLSIQDQQDVRQLRQLMIDKTERIRSLCMELPDARRITEEKLTTLQTERVNIPIPIYDEVLPLVSEVVEPDAASPSAQAETLTGSTPPEQRQINKTHSQGDSERGETDSIRPLMADRPVNEHYQSKRNLTERSALRRIFTLNEIFMFRRELFDGADDDFNASLSIVESLPSFADAEAYFYSDLQWDKKDGMVAEFMQIIKRYFHK